MSFKKKLNGQVFWGYSSQILSFGINLILLPLILYYLKSEEIGIWYNFAAIYALALLLDFGLSTTTTRGVAYAWVGADINTGEEGNGKPNVELIVNLYHGIKKLYTIVSLCAFILLAIFGTYYILSISSGVQNNESVRFAWFLYLLAIVFNLKEFYWTPLLRGVGAVELNYKVNVISKVFNILICSVLFAFDFGLISLCLSYLFSVVIGRVVSRIFFFRYMTHHGMDCFGFKGSGDKEKIKDYIVNVKGPVLKQGLLSITNYLNDKLLIFMVTFFFGLEVSGSFGVTSQIIGVICVIGNVYYNTKSPKMIQLKRSCRNSQALLLLYKSLSIQVITIISMSLIFLFIGPEIVSWFSSDVKLLETKYILVMVLFSLFYNYQLLCVNYIIMDNRFPMLISYIISAVVFCITSWSMLTFNMITLYELILLQIVVLLCFNAWMWPKCVARQERVGMFEFFIFSLRFGGVRDK